ncbi:MAG: GGDEF and EAL domain-containing protein [Lachnospiraceae bacterium]|nr:GGDEF and EAL domain-containing protein [Lachnospiraceae bacterium]
MHKLSEDLFQNAVDLNETIVFEYDIKQDAVRFSDNLSKYIPISQNISAFVENMITRGKVHSDDVKSAIAFFSSSKGGGKVRMEYVRFLDFNGEYRWYQLKGRAQLDEHGKPVTLFGTLTYIDDETKKRNEEESKERDELTHLLKEKVIMESIDAYIENAPVDVIPNMLLVDVDDFEEWSETHGDISGDGAIMEISKILKRAFRSSDMLGRLPEDRFIISMKGVHAVGILLERASYLRQAVKDVFSDIENSGGLTVSIGIAAFDVKEATSAKLLQKATDALKDAKRSGKDTYVLYSGDSERIDTSVNPILSTKEMELVRNLLDPMCTWAYAVDENYQLLYRNEILQERLGNTNCGLCYIQNKGYAEPCPDCPMKNMDSKKASVDSNVYSTSLRTVIPTRTTQITLRNGKHIYIIASVKEDIENQIAALDESEIRIQNALYMMTDIIWDVDIFKNTCVRMKEDNVGSVMDMRIDNFKRLRDYYVAHIVHPEDVNAFLEATDPKYLKQEIRVGKRSVCREARLKNLEGEYRWYSIYATFMKPEEPADEAEMRAIIAAQPIHDFKLQSIAEAETKVKYEIMRQKSDIAQEMALNFERTENVNEMIGILIYEYYVQEDSYYLCATFDEVFKIDHKALTGEWGLLRALHCHQGDQDKFDEFIEEIKKTQQTQKVTVRLYNRYDTPVWYTIYVQPLRGLDNRPVRYLGTFQNVNTEMEIKAEMEYRADFDSMTGLYNAEAFYRKATELIHLNEDSLYAVLSIDIEKFRLINDKFGIEIGNRCLSYMGKSIREIMPKNSLAKRYQGDTFTVLMEYNSEQDILNFINNLTSRMHDNDTLPQSVSIVFGIYKVTDKSLPIRLMCDRARTVKRQAKGSIFTNYAVYDDVIRLKMREQAEIEEEMEMALHHHEFTMYLQPQIDVKTGKLCGAEALVRWEHPIKGVMVPAQFLPLFESNGFITRLDRFMWEEACKYLAELKKREIEIPISVNVSRAHVMESDLCKVLSDLVNRYGITTDKLELEITENLFVDDVDELFGQMEELKRRGFKIQMDDFGSGYSSLNMLRKAPVDTLKIDRFFLDEIMSTSRGKIIVEASVKMAKELGLKVIAEGVETEEQLKFLSDAGCDIAQGYYYSKPITVEGFEEFIKEHY